MAWKGHLRNCFSDGLCGMPPVPREVLTGPSGVSEVLWGYSGKGAPRPLRPEIPLVVFLLSWRNLAYLVEEHIQQRDVEIELEGSDKTKLYKFSGPGNIAKYCSRSEC